MSAVYAKMCATSQDGLQTPFLIPQGFLFLRQSLIWNALAVQVDAPHTLPDAVQATEYRKTQNGSNSAVECLSIRSRLFADESQTVIWRGSKVWRFDGCKMDVGGAAGRSSTMEIPVGVYAQLSLSNLAQ